jgi:nucleoside phosphorylase
MRIAILGAMVQEALAYHTLRKNNPAWKKHDIYVGLTGVGKTAAAMRTQKAIYEHNPDILIFSGVAAALEDKLEIGDIGLCENAIDSDLNVRT